MKKRILAILTCVLLLMGSISVTAFAAEPTGSITIKNRASSGATIEGKTFVAYKVFNATATADGKHTSYSWGHDAYKTFLFEGTAPLIPADQQGNKTVNDAIKYISSLQEGSLGLSEFAEGLYKKVRDYNNDASNTNKIPVAGQETVPVAGEGQTVPYSVTIENLPYGYYMVHDETELAGAAVRSAVMMCNVDRNVSVEVELKANRPQIEKKVFDNEGVWSEGTSATIGDIVPFKIETVIPSHILYSTYSYVIKDVMPDGLALDEESIVVKLVEGDEIKTLTEESDGTAGDYTLSLGDNVVDSEGNIIDKAAYVDEFVDGEKAWDFVISFNDLRAFIGNKLVVEYNAKVTKSAQPLNDNAAVLEYSNDPLHEDSRGYSGNIARVNVYKMILTKVAADAAGQTTNIHLAGAKFKLSDESGNLINFVKEEQLDNGNVYIQYRVAENGEGNTVTELEVYDPDRDINSGSSIEARSAQTGNLVIYGLKEGVYSLEEIQAPDGYILPNKPFTLTITDTIGSIGGIVSSLSFVGEHKDDNFGIVDNARGDYTAFTVAADITNIPGNALPETGGMGTTLFTILGIILMAGAVAYLAVRRKKAAA